MTKPAGRSRRKIPSSRNQIPNKFQPSKWKNSKIGNALPRRIEFENWLLKFIWNLEFGTWNFRTRCGEFFVEAAMPPPNAPRMPLHRSRNHKIIAGVCGGLADWLGWSPTLVRVLFVVVSALSAAFPGIVVYLVMWVLMPRAER